MTTNQLRKSIINMREELSAQLVKDNSLKITDALFSTDEFLRHSSYFVYKSFRGEICTDEIISRLEANDKTILYPVIVGDEMIAALPSSTKTTRDKFGVEIPLSYTEFDSPEVAIVPLVACDFRCNRMGFGKGYYDKFFAKNKCLKIGICHDFQVVNDLKPNPWDVPLDLIITEKRLLLP